MPVECAGFPFWLLSTEAGRGILVGGAPDPAHLQLTFTKHRYKNLLFRSLAATLFPHYMRWLLHLVCIYLCVLTGVCLN